MTTKDKVIKLDKRLRDKPGMTSDKFIKEYCPVLANHAYATYDGTMNEMEKTLCHVVSMLIYYDRFAEILGFGNEEGFDPRDFVDPYEEQQEMRQKEVKEASNQLLKDTLNQGS